MQKTGRNTKLILIHYWVHACSKWKTATLHTDRNGIRMTVNLLNPWPVKDCCRLKSAVTQVCRLLPMFRWNALMPSSYIPKRGYILTNRSGFTLQKAGICRVTVAGTSDLVHETNIFFCFSGQMIPLSQWWANFFRSGQKKNLAGHNDLL